MSVSQICTSGNVCPSTNPAFCQITLSAIRETPITILVLATSPPNSTAPFHPHAGGFIDEKAAPNVTGAVHGCWQANSNMDKGVVIVYSITSTYSTSCPLHGSQGNQQPSDLLALNLFFQI